MRKCSTKALTYVNIHKKLITQNDSFLYSLVLLLPDKPGKLAQCIPIYETILGLCIHNRANAWPFFLVCWVLSFL